MLWCDAIKLPDELTANRAVVEVRMLGGNSGAGEFSDGVAHVTSDKETLSRAHTPKCFGWHHRSF